MRLDVLPFALVLSLAACSPGGSGTPATSAPAPKREELRIQGSTGSMETELNVTDAVVSNGVALAPDSAWRALPAVYRALGLSITRYDEATRTIGGERLRSRRSFGGKTLVQLLDCGDTGGMPNASRFDVSMSVATTVGGSGTDATLATRVQASAAPSTTAGHPTRCTANGRIATIIADAVKGGAGS